MNQDYLPVPWVMNGLGYLRPPAALDITNVEARSKGSSVRPTFNKALHHLLFPFLVILQNGSSGVMLGQAVM